MSWYKEAFGEDYLLLYSHRDDREAGVFVRRMLERLELPHRATVLDLCCGAGRYALQCADAGCRVVGLDLSPILLYRALELSRERGLTVHWLRADMRHIPAGAVFDLTLNMFTSFGYFRDDADNFRVIEDIRRVTRSNGTVVLDFFNPQQVAESLVPFDEYTLNGVTVTQTRLVDYQDRRIEKTITITEENDQREYRESVRLYEKSDLERMFGQAGFTIAGIYGNYRLEPWTPESPRTILVARNTP